jgi:pyrroline-5-carboxylate reductase
MKDKNIAFIGCGNMGRALVGGLIADGYPADKIWVSDPEKEQLDLICNRYPVHAVADNEHAVSEAEVVVLAVKPQVMKTVVTGLVDSLKVHQPLVVSIAAGINTNTLSRWLDGAAPIVRAMPNTPALVGSGATALYAEPGVDLTQREAAEAILRAVGLTVWLEDESLMDVVTALSGSGPAYYFLLMELMEKAAIDQGLPEATARLLTIQTAFGAAKMALETSADPATLRAQVTSPGGTTAEALKVFEESGLLGIVERALGAARNRSEELARLLGGEA